jgi:hypothetical protein
MTAQEQYFYDQVIATANELVVENNLLRIQLLDLRAELSTTYKILADLKFDRNIIPIETDIRFIGELGKSESAAEWVPVKKTKRKQPKNKTITK